MSAASSSDPRLLRLDERDNVLIVTAPIEAGERFVVEGGAAQAASHLRLGFKIAADDLPAGTVARRYGQPIGRTTADIRRGELIHTHNLESQYMRTHARGEQ